MTRRFGGQEYSSEMEKLTQKEDGDDRDPRVEEVPMGKTADQITHVPKPKIKRGLSEGEPSTSKKLHMQEQVVERDEEAEGPNNIFSDKINIAPHLQSLAFSLILKELDFRTLKQARLVRKSWWNEAHNEMERRGIVSLYTEYGCSVRIQNFLEFTDRKIMRALPQPFKHIAVDLRNVQGLFVGLNPKRLVRELGLLRPLIVITKLSPWPLPWDLAQELIQLCAPTLECLKLILARTEEDVETDEPPENPQPNVFPKLVHVVVDVDLSTLPERPASLTFFQSLVSRVVSGSPSLENCETLMRWRSLSDRERDFESKLLLQLDLKTVKTLNLAVPALSNEALTHFSSTSFCRLENLRVCISEADFSSVTRMKHIVGVVNKSVATLKKLSYFGSLDAAALARHGFPTCTSLLELTVDLFPKEDQYFESFSFLSKTFPVLKVLNVQFFMFRECFWIGVTPCLGLKTLRIHKISRETHALNQQPKELLLSEKFFFFKTFPNLECLQIEPSFLLSVCEMKASPEPRYLHLLDSLRTLELKGKAADYGDPNNSDADFSFLAVLKRLETITFHQFFGGITTVPLKDLPCLKTIQFPWGPEVESKELIEFAKAVEVVIVTDCCSVLRTGDIWSKNLQSFLDSTPNAHCGCKEQKKLLF